MDGMIATAIIAGIVAAGGSGSAVWVVLRTRMGYVEQALCRVETKVDKINGNVDCHETRITVLENVNKWDGRDRRR